MACVRAIDTRFSRDQVQVYNVPNGIFLIERYSLRIKATTDAKEELTARTGWYQTNVREKIGENGIFTGVPMINS